MNEQEILDEYGEWLLKQSETSLRLTTEVRDLWVALVELQKTVNKIIERMNILETQ